jgi:hypothetical protein
LRVVAGTVHSSSVRTVFLDTAASQATASALADDLGLATDVLHPVERVAAGEDHSPSCDRTSPPYGAASSATPSDRQGPASTEGTGAPGTRRVTPETGTPITRLRIVVWVEHRRTGTTRPPERHQAPQAATISGCDATTRAGQTTISSTGPQAHQATG